VDRLREDDLPLAGKLLAPLLEAGTGLDIGPLGRWMGVRFTAWGDGQATCELDLDERFWNLYGIAHGGAAYALADFGMGAAVTSLLQPGQRCVTIEIHMHYLAPVRRGRLICNTQVVHMGTHVAFLTSEVCTQEATLVARATGSFFIIPQA
jgi:acyl-CoA thioesterase